MLAELVSALLGLLLSRYFSKLGENSTLLRPVVSVVVLVFSLGDGCGRTPEIRYSACGDDESEGDLKGDMCGAEIRLGTVILSTGLGCKVLVTGLSRPSGELDVEGDRIAKLECRCRCCNIS